jgi:hypothetical protein
MHTPRTAQAKEKVRGNKRARERRAALFAGPGGTQPAECAGLRGGRGGPRSKARRGKELSTGQRRHLDTSTALHYSLPVEARTGELLITSMNFTASYSLYQHQ